MVKNPSSNAGNAGSIPVSGRCPGGGNDTTVFLPGKSHRQRSQAGYSPWGRKESYTTEHAGVLPCQNGIKLKGEDPSFSQYGQSLGVTGARQALKARPRTQHCWSVSCVREWRKADPLRAPPRPAAQHGPLHLKYRDGDCSARAQGTHHLPTPPPTHTLTLTLTLTAPPNPRCAEYQAARKSRDSGLCCPRWARSLRSPPGLPRCCKQSALELSSGRRLV